MADRYYEARSGETPVYGNLARSSPDPEIRREALYDMPPDDSSAAEEAEKPEIRSVPRTKQHIAPAAVLGFIIAAGMIISLLTVRIRLTEISNESAILESKIEQLKTERKRLLIEYESAFNPAEIEEYAINVLKMQKPGSDQLFYIDAGASDKVVIPKDDSSGDGYLSVFSDLTSGLRQLLR